MLLSVDIGGGPNLLPGFVNLDPLYGHGPWKRYAQDVPWPTGPASVEKINATHVLEHVAAGGPRLAVFDEAHRVLTEGGELYVEVPLFPHSDAIADPTHLSYFVPESFLYFDARSPMLYGIRPWMIEYCRVANDRLIQCLMRPA